VIDGHDDDDQAAQHVDGCQAVGTLIVHETPQPRFSGRILNLFGN
jgi:hypothetical protein